MAKTKKVSKKSKKEAAQSAENEVKIEVQSPETEEVVDKNTSKKSRGKKGKGKLSDLELMVIQKETEKAELNDTYLRLAAEFDNFRKRTQKEKALLIEYASESVITALLPVLDDFERTLTAMETTDNLSSLKDGIRLVNENMWRALKKEGLEPIESKGKPFDSEYHDAITSVPVKEEDQKGQVIDEAEKGYRLKDRVIRYSKVIVGE